MRIFIPKQLKGHADFITRVGSSPLPSGWLLPLVLALAVLIFLATGCASYAICTNGGCELSNAEVAHQQEAVQTILAYYGMVVSYPGPAIVWVSHGDLPDDAQTGEPRWTVDGQPNYGVFLPDWNRMMVGRHNDSVPLAKTDLAHELMHYRLWVANGDLDNGHTNHVCWGYLNTIGPLALDRGMVGVAQKLLAEKGY